MFYLTTLNLNRFLYEEPPVVREEGVWNQAAVDAWLHCDYLSRNYVLSFMSDDLYKVYESLNTAKAVWDALEFKYKTQDAGTTKFLVGKFLEYRMVEEKSVEEQVEELEVMFHEMHAEGMTLSESFQAASIIEKLPPSWGLFKNYLKHKRKEMSVKAVGVRLKVEEGNRKAGKGTVVPTSYEGEANANIVHHGSSSKSFKGKKNNLAPRGNQFKKSCN